HSPAPFPPARMPPAAGATQSANVRSGGQQLNNPTPQVNVMRALLRDLHAWVADGTAPPASRYPHLADASLVPASEVRFPRLPGVSDPRQITAPARLVSGKVVALPHLVPQVDSDGNDLGGIRDPEAAVPLATTTGWNFRDPSVGNSCDLYKLLGAVLSFRAP